MTNTETKRSIIEQIHHEFNTASDSALAEAKAILAGVSNDSRLLTLHQLGFKNAKGVQSHISQKGTMADYKKICDLIVEYQVKFPKHKFITEVDVQRICKKYSLGCAPVDCYHGDVPAKNVQDIAEFVERYGNYPSYELVTSINYRYRSLEEDEIELFQSVWLSNQNQSKLTKRELEAALSKYRVTAQVESKIIRFNESLHICAPKRDLNLKGLKQIGNIFSRVVNNVIKETYEDPIVLCKVADGYLIVTAWGDEASDPLVVNPQSN